MVTGQGLLNQINEPTFTAGQHQGLCGPWRPGNKEEALLQNWRCGAIRRTGNIPWLGPSSPRSHPSATPTAYLYHGASGTSRPPPTKTSCVPCSIAEYGYCRPQLQEPLRPGTNFPRCTTARQRLAHALTVFCTIRARVVSSAGSTTVSLTSVRPSILRVSTAEIWHFKHRYRGRWASPTQLATMP